MVEFSFANIKFQEKRPRVSNTGRTVRGLYKYPQLSLAVWTKHDYAEHKHLWKPQTDFKSFIHIIFYLAKVLDTELFLAMETRGGPQII